MHTYLHLDNQLSSLSHVFIDLDGTFVHEELITDYAFQLIKKNPFKALPYLYKHLTNRRKQKFELAKQLNSWTVRQPLKNLLEKHKHHLHITLITGSCTTLGQRVADAYPDLFDKVFGSTIEYECIGLNKIPYMKTLHPHPFYIGNSMQDIPIFNTLGQGCCITNSSKVIQSLQRSDIIIIPS